MKLFSKINLSTLILSVVVIVCFAIIGFNVYAETSFDKSYEANNAQINELKAELEKVSSENDTKPDVESDTIKKTLYSAADVGNKVAVIQSKYSGITDIDFEGYAKNAEEVKPFFDNVLDSHMAWYQGHLKYKWVFGTTYSVTEKNISTIFLCYEDEKDKNTLLAYTLADFDAEKQKFTSRKTVMTMYGAEKQIATTPVESEGY